jgi:RNA polymerase sigma-70 factor (ECF subfamily)
MDSTGLSAATFSELYQRYGRDVYRYSFYLSGNAAVAEDIAADVFLRVWSSAQPVRIATVKAYLLVIARNLYLHGLRHSGRARELDPNAAGGGSLSRDAESREELAQVLGELQQFPEIDRSALLLRAEHGLSYEEIAAALEISVAAAKVKVHRARVRLAERFPRSTNA